METLRRTFCTLLLAVSLAATSGCSAGGSRELPSLSVPAASVALDTRISLEEATAIAETQLTGIDTNDYDMFTTAFDADMRAALGPDRFAELRQDLAPYGHFQSIVASRVTPGRAEGTVRFYFVSRFEHADLVWMIAFRIDGTEVIGALVGTVAE